MVCNRKGGKISYCTTGSLSDKRLTHLEAHDVSVGLFRIELCFLLRHAAISLSNVLYLFGQHDGVLSYDDITAIMNVRS